MLASVHTDIPGCVTDAEITMEKITNVNTANRLDS